MRLRVGVRLRLRLRLRVRVRVRVRVRGWLQPDRGHDEVKLDEDGAEGQDAADEHREEQVEVPRLVRGRVIRG